MDGHYGSLQAPHTCPHPNWAPMEPGELHRVKREGRQRKAETLQAQSPPRDSLLLRGVLRAGVGFEAAMGVWAPDPPPESCVNSLCGRNRRLTPVPGHSACRPVLSTWCVSQPVDTEAPSVPRGQGSGTAHQTPGPGSAQREERLQRLRSTLPEPLGV